MYLFAEVLFYNLFTDVEVEVFVNTASKSRKTDIWEITEEINRHVIILPINIPVCLTPIERWILITRSCISIVLHIAHRLPRSWGKQINDQMESRRPTFLQLPTSTWHKYFKMRRENHIWRNSQLYH